MSRRELHHVHVVTWPGGHRWYRTPEQADAKAAETEGATVTVLRLPFTQEDQIDEAVRRFAITGRV